MGRELSHQCAYRCLRTSYCWPLAGIWLTTQLRCDFHYSDVLMGAMASEITSFTIVYSTLYSGADQRKHQSSASLAFVRGIHWWHVNSPHKELLPGKMFPFDYVTMFTVVCEIWRYIGLLRQLLRYGCHTLLVDINGNLNTKNTSI